MSDLLQVQQTSGGPSEDTSKASPPYSIPYNVILSTRNTLSGQTDIVINGAYVVSGKTELMEVTASYEVFLVAKHHVMIVENNRKLTL